MSTRRIYNKTYYERMKKRDVGTRIDDQLSVHPTGRKICSCCKKDNPLSEYNICSGKIDGLTDYCKYCVHKYSQNRTKKLKSRSQKEIIKIQEAMYPNNIKKCNSCDTEYYLSAFCDQFSNPDGKSIYCKTCTNIRKKETGRKKRKTVSDDINIVHETTEYSKKTRTIEEIIEIQNTLYENGMKMCSVCKKFSSISYFRDNKNSYDGKITKCYICIGKKIE